MRYIPDRETLAETLARVMTTNGLSTSEAQVDICRALNDGKIQILPTIDPNATEIGSQLVDVRSIPWEKVRQRLERQKIVPVPLIPKNLDPQDFDWENSRPISSWVDTRGCSVGIAKIEFYTARTIRVLCGGRTGRPAHDAPLAGSSSGRFVQTTEPASPPKTDVASADQVADLEVQTHLTEGELSAGPVGPVSASTSPLNPNDVDSGPAHRGAGERAAIKALAGHLKSHRDLTRAEATNWLATQKFAVSGRGFQSRVWPEARRQAGLTSIAPPGAKKKSSRGPQRSSKSSTARSR
jgi:hypothetical protein